jgi:hypothetical protein
LPCQNERIDFVFSTNDPSVENLFVYCSTVDRVGSVVTEESTRSIVGNTQKD